MKHLFVLVVCAYLTSCSGESTRDSPPSNAAPDALVTLHNDFYPAVNKPASFADITSLAYQPSTAQLLYGTSNLQSMQYWPPQNVLGREHLPALIFVHGGCWSNSFRVEQSYPIATALALNGFPVWSIEYRATGDQGGGWPGTFEDVNSAIQTIIDTSAEYYSSRKLVVLGHSAGGHLALLARSQQQDGYTVVGLAAITDIVSYANDNGSCNGLTRSFMGGTPSSVPERYESASPQLVNIGNAGFLFAGSKDAIVKLSQASGSGLPYAIEQSANHFDWIHPGRPAFAVLVNYLFEIDAQ
ncbi:alpha/beta hydrolase [Aliiglaciecola litoralis]|uniref:Alpha/beta hydrolase n=1 Tax=Aliiglaciecola litoralis TaxID=582857 RepID=A0ABN1LK59_9ALTE